MIQFTRNHLDRWYDILDANLLGMNAYSPGYFATAMFAAQQQYMHRIYFSYNVRYRGVYRLGLSHSRVALMRPNDNFTCDDIATLTNINKLLNAAWRT